MKYLAILFFTIATQLTYGQEGRVKEKTLKEQVADDADKYLTKLSKDRLLVQNRELQKFGFSDIHAIDAEFIFRYCTIDSVIEVIESEGSFLGIVIFFTEGVKKDGEKETYSVKKQLPDEVCLAIKQLFNEDTMKIFIDENNIVGNRTFSNHSIEIIKDNAYLFKLFGSFSTRKINHKKRQLEQMLDEILILSDYNEIKKGFKPEYLYNHYRYWNGYGVWISH